MPDLLSLAPTHSGTRATPRGDPTLGLEVRSHAAPGGTTHKSRAGGQRKRFQPPSCRLCKLASLAQFNRPEQTPFLHPVDTSTLSIGRFRVKAWRILAPAPQPRWLGYSAPQRVLGEGDLDEPRSSIPPARRHQAQESANGTVERSDERRVELRPLASRRSASSRRDRSPMSRVRNSSTLIRRRR